VSIAALIAASQVAQGNPRRLEFVHSCGAEGGTDDRFLSSVVRPALHLLRTTDHKRRWSVPRQTSVCPTRVKPAAAKIGCPTLTKWGGQSCLQPPFRRPARKMLESPGAGYHPGHYPNAARFSRGRTPAKTGGRNPREKQRENGPLRPWGGTFGAVCRSWGRKTSGIVDIILPHIPSVSVVCHVIGGI
jgi:hypothetical protein